MVKKSVKKNSKASPGNAMPKPITKTGKNLPKTPSKLANTRRPGGNWR